MLLQGLHHPLQGLMVQHQNPWKLTTQHRPMLPQMGHTHCETRHMEEPAIFTAERRREGPCQKEDGEDVCGLSRSHDGCGKYEAARIS